MDVYCFQLELEERKRLLRRLTKKRMLSIKYNESAMYTYCISVLAVGTTFDTMPEKIHNIMLISER